MTTSQPKYNTNGHQVWNPDVGIYATSYWGNRESYGGIIGALQDVSASAGGTVKSYPHNFAGIIAAIQDLTIAGSSPPVIPGPDPGGGTIDPITGDWIEVAPPVEGTLWFDTRQGRLFCYIDSEWVQTNGADGLAAITPDNTPPTLEDTGIPAPGQFWYDRGSNSLWIHDGIWVDVDGDPEDPSTPGAAPRWRLVNVDPGEMLQTTATLPLAGTGPRSVMDADTLGDIIAAPDFENFNNQQDYNWWAFNSLISLEEAIINKSEVVVGDEPPGAPHEGLLWYDTESLDLSIYYEDDDSGQWVPVSTPYTYDEDLDVIRYDLSQETRLREQAIQGIYNELNNLDIASNGTVQTIQNTIASAQQEIQTLKSANYITKSEADADYAELAGQIAGLVIPPAPDLSPYVEKTTVNTLQQQVNSLPTTADLNAVSAAIPDVTAFVEQSDIDTSISNITVDYLPRTGGELTGSFTFDKSDYSLPALDFSGTPATSNNAFKFQALAPSANNYTTFGSTSNFWEYAWEFSGDEDFCWIYSDTNKVFSITKDGPACSQLYIGDFTTNDANGRVITNRIDVRERLNIYQTTLEQVRQAVSNSTDFDSLKSGLLTALANV